MKTPRRAKHNRAWKGSLRAVLGLWGPVDSEAEKAAVETLPRTIDGVTGVENHLVVRQDAPYLSQV